MICSFIGEHSLGDGWITCGSRGNFAIRPVLNLKGDLIITSGNGKKELQDQFIGRELDRLLKERGQVLAESGDSSYVKVIPDMKEFRDEAICPIISEGDVIGSVILLGKDHKKRFGEVEQRIASSAADFLGRQMP